MDADVDTLVGKIGMACAWAHRLFSMELHDDSGQSDGGWDVAFFKERVQHPVLGDCLVGWKIAGIGVVNVHFPVAHVRRCTPDEIARYSRPVFNSTFAGRFGIPEQDFAVDYGPRPDVATWNAWTTAEYPGPTCLVCGLPVADRMLYCSGLSQCFLDAMEAQ